MAPSAGTGVNSLEVRELKGRGKEAEKVIRQLEASQRRMGVKLSEKIKQRIDKEQLKSHLATGVSIFASVLDITFAVVRFVGFFSCL